MHQLSLPLFGNRKKRTNVRHGKRNTREYGVWATMIQRCENSGYRKYPSYGGRGISVCDCWRKSFAAFYADMGPRPSSQHSIDRINNDGNYEPGNCRWATRTDQCRNRRSSCFLTIGEETKTLAEWSDISGLSVATIWHRIHKCGWSHLQATTLPLFSRGDKAHDGICG